MCARVLAIVCLLLLTCASSAVRGDATPPKPPTGSGDAPKPERVTTELELAIERVVPMSRYSGTAMVATADPRFVLVGQVAWVQRPEVLALGSRQAFAIHSPTRLGLATWARGSTICLLLTRTRSSTGTQWELDATKPDAGCRGGG